MSAEPHKYATRSAAIRAARAACKKALGPAYEAYEGADFIIHSERPSGELQMKHRFQIVNPEIHANR
jgi:hypothetical protein